MRRRTNRTPSPTLHTKEYDGIEYRGLPMDWFDYCLPGDIYGNADIFGTYLKQGYDIATPLTLADPFGMIALIAPNIARWAQTGELGPINFFRLVKTGFDLGVFLRDKPKSSESPIRRSTSSAAHDETVRLPSRP